MKRTLVILLIAVLLASCGGGKSEGQSTTTATPTTEAQVQKVDLSQVPEEWPKLNEELATKGESCLPRKGATHATWFPIKNLWDLVLRG